MQGRIDGKEFFKEILKGVIIFVIGVLIGILCVALVVRLAVLQSNVIKIINQFLKTGLIVLAVAVSVRGGLAIVKGGLIGVVGTILIYLIFSLFGGQVSFGLSFVIDLILTAVVGGLSAVILVNLKNR